MDKPVTKMRFLVLYIDEDFPKCRRTYGVYAAKMSIATALVIQYIEDHEHHDGPGGYTLTPNMSMEKADYEINKP